LTTIKYITFSPIAFFNMLMGLCPDLRPFCAAYWPGNRDSLKRKRLCANEKRERRNLWQ
jgi:hypothetical protein